MNCVEFKKNAIKKNQSTKFTWFLFLIIYIPFQIALNPGFRFDLASLRFLIVLFSLLYLVEVLYKNNFKNFLNKIDSRVVYLVIFLLLSSFSLINADNIIWGIRKIIFFLSIFPLYFLSVFLINNWRRIKKIILSLVISGSILAFIGLIQFFSQFIFTLEKTYSFWAMNILPVFSGFNLGTMILAYPSWLVNIGGETIMRAFSIFSDPHMLSFYIGLILPLDVMLIYWETKKEKNNILFYLILFLILYIPLLLTFSRGAYVSVIFSFLILAFFFWKYLNNRKIVILLCFSLLIFIIPITPIADRFYSTFNLDEGSNVGRLEMWQIAGTIGMDSFWSGVGLGNYSLIIDAEFDYRNPATAHNLYLDIFSEIGFFGLIIWLFLILGTTWQIFKKLKFIKNENKKCALICLIGSFSYFFAHSFFETPIYSPSVLALLMVILGLSSILLKNDSKIN